MMSKETNFDWEPIVQRMYEESGVKSLRKLDEAIGTPESYVYAQMKRGVSKGYMEKYLTAFPDADYNYIFKGVEDEPKSFDVSCRRVKIDSPLRLRISVF